MRGAHGNPIYNACRGCGTPVRTYPSRRAAGKDQFCTRACRHKHTTRAVECPVCGKQWVHQTSQNGGTYCSTACWSAATTDERKCAQCGTAFRKPKCKAKAGRGKFCSTACFWASMKIPPEQKKENARAHVRAYRKANPEWTAACKHRRRVRERAGGHFSASSWKAIKAGQGFRCPRCGKAEPEIKLTVDHIIPVSKGGSNAPENIQGLCGPCNSRKSNNQ